MPNEIFRMVGLRQSKSSNGDVPPSPDPRLRYRGILEGQTTVTTSSREAKLTDLRNRYAQLAKQIAQFETIQGAVVDAYMADLQRRPVHMNSASPPGGSP